MMPLWLHWVLVIGAALVFLLLRYLHKQHAGSRRLLQLLGLWLFRGSLLALFAYPIARLVLALSSVISPEMQEWSNRLDQWAGHAVGWIVFVGLFAAIVMCTAGAIALTIIIPTQALWRWWQT